jgi:hypothetical protein
MKRNIDPIEGFGVINESAKWDTFAPLFTVYTENLVWIYLAQTGII